MNFSIRTATDPDLGSDEGLTQHTLATETFQTKLWALCQANEVFSNDHERSAELYQRAAFDTALELKVELVQEDIPGGIQFTFNFVPTIIITELADQLDAIEGEDRDPASLNEDCYGYTDADRDVIDAELIREAEAEADNTPIQRELDTVEQYAVDRAVGNLEDEGASDAEICDTIRGMIETWDSLTYEQREEAQYQAAERAEAVNRGPCECGAGRRGDGTLKCGDPSIIGYLCFIDGALIGNYSTEAKALEAGEVEADNDDEEVTVEPQYWTDDAKAEHYAQEEEQAERFDRFTPGTGLYFCACDGVETPDVSWCARCRPPQLNSINQGSGLWGLTLDGVVVLKDESYAVVHGIIEDADVGELQEIRDSLLRSDKATAVEATGTRFLSDADEFEAARIGRAIAYLLHLTPNDNPDSVRFDTVTGDKTYIGLARTLARIFDNEEYRQKLVLDSIDHLPCDPEEEDLEPDDCGVDDCSCLEDEEEFTDGLEDYRGGGLV